MNWDSMIWGGLVSEWCYDWYDEKMWSWLPKENPCFEKLSMLEKESLTKSYRGISQLSKVYKGADRNEYPNATWYNRFSLLLTNSSTIGIRLVRNSINDDSSKTSTKVDYSKLITNEPKKMTIERSADGKWSINGQSLNDDEIDYIKDKNNKIGYEPFISKKTTFTGTGQINDSRVRLRSEPNLDCETVTYLNRNDAVKIKDQSDRKFEIDGEKWYWHQVETSDGKTGWVYGKYLDIEKE